MTNAIQEARNLGQSIWYDNIRRALITSGELHHLVDLGVSGLTSNPTIFEKAIAGSTDYDEALRPLANQGLQPLAIYEALVIADIQAAADLLRPVYEATNGVDGYASLEVSPALAHDADATVDEAKRLWSTLARPNVLIKVPATAEGIPALRRLIGQGINVNVTLIFSLDVYRQVMDAYLAGLEDFSRAGGDVSSVASVASFFVSRVDSVVDALLADRIAQERGAIRALRGKAAIANAKLAYQLFKATFSSPRFAELRARGARVQRPLWASTSTKNPAYPDLIYVEPLIGPDTVNTMPHVTLHAFLDHGRAAALIEHDVSDAEETIQSLTAAGISMEQVTAGLLDDGLRSFADSFEKLLVNIREKQASLLADGRPHPGSGLGPRLSVVDRALEDFERRDIVGRIWRKDHSVWSPEPTEIVDRLGWLTVAETMSEQVSALESFAQDVRADGLRHVVLLGMGGSSLGPEVLARVFGSSPGYPELLVLDSTVPAWVQGVASRIEPEGTLFLVSSKSGGTIETLSLYRHFHGLVESRVAERRVGAHFVAITDPGTSLERLALEHQFRRVFLNPPDIGGRYSILSYFGLVPAALAGIDIATLLDRAECMRQGCASCVPDCDDPGAWLGAALGSLAVAGLDKLTLVTSPALESFGLWLEQLIAESTGKQGKGIVPVAGEPIWPPEVYGEDRLFVYLRLEGDDNGATDEGLERLRSAGRPVIRFTLRDRYDLGAEFFRWELATAAAGAVLGIHPFDQPNVQQAKDLTDAVLQAYRANGRLPDPGEGLPLNALLRGGAPPEYLAVMAYMQPTPQVDRALAELREKVTSRYHIATTIGYGPRFLHSTGQLHKGGPPTGRFLQLTTEHSPDPAIPDAGYTFGTLADAQAIGDLRALREIGRPVARVRLGKDPVTDIQRLAAALLAAN